MPLAAGSHIGPYEILAAIGAGGMGQVWRAHDTRLERDVALKVLPAEETADATARTRLVREARLASKLNHPHICTIYEVGEADPSTGSTSSPQASSGQAVARPPGPGTVPGRRAAAVPRRRWMAGAAAGVLALLIAAGVLFGLDVGRIRSRVMGSVTTIRLAVLPLANLSGDAGQEYLSDGLTQELIAQLGRLHPETLSVIARTSVMRYKNTDTPVDQIGRELGVDFVLEGSAQRQGDRIRIAAELVKVADQTQLWADTYERDLSAILMVQGQVAQSVAKALAVRLLPAEEARLAVAKDPSHAPAHRGLAWVWLVRGQTGLISPSEAGPKAKAAAQQAIALDDNSAEAHEALAWVLTWADWEWAGAGREWTRALELNPNGANAHAYYAHYLAIM